MNKQIDFDTVMAEVHHVCRWGAKTYIRYGLDHWITYINNERTVVCNTDKLVALEKAFREYYKLEG